MCSITSIFNKIFLFNGTASTFLISRLAEENAGMLKVGKVNVDEQPELASMFGVVSIPTLILFKNGKAVSSSVGVQPKSHIEQMFK